MRTVFTSGTFRRGCDDGLNCCRANLAQAPQRAVLPHSKRRAAQVVAHQSTIQFEDATDKSGIDFTHSFGSAKLGSLLEGTGAGCVWFDYNNSGLPSLYVVSGRPLDDSMHPYPLKVKPNPPPHNHLYRNDGNGHFTDVTDQSGLNPDMYSDRGNGGRLRQRWQRRPAGNRLRQGRSLPQRRQRPLYRCDREGRHQGGRMGDQLHVARLRQGRLPRSLRGPLRQVRSQIPRLLRRGQLSRAARLRRRDQHALPQQLRRNFHRRN